MVLNAVILAAGRGARLAPLTDRTPKCLLPVGGRAILDWQLDALARRGATAVTIVTGHAADSVDAHVAGRQGIRTVRNADYSSTDNLASCRAARDHFGGDASVLLNGDTLFEDAILADLLAAEATPVLIAIDRKPHYDADDMKIMTTDTNRLRRIGKDLAAPDGEAIGLTLLRDTGRARFLDRLEACLAAPGGTHALYTEALGALAAQDLIGVRAVHGRRWIEIDTAQDRAAAEALWR